MRFCLLLALTLVFSTSSAHAIVFERDVIRILPRVDVFSEVNPSTPQTQGSQTENQDNAVPPSRPVIELMVEIRGEQVLQTDWLHLSQLFQADDGMMILFDIARVVPISPRNFYTELDILLIDQQGIITQIAPNVNLSELYQDIYPSTAVKAWLYVAAGTVKLQDIRPGDMIEHRHFLPDPLLLN